MRDLVAARFPKFGGAAEPGKCLQEERLNVVRLKPPSFCPLHIFADTEDAAGIHRVVSQRTLLHQILQVLGRRRSLALDSGVLAPRAALRTGWPQSRGRAGACHRTATSRARRKPVRRGLPRLFELLKEGSVNIAFAGFVGHEVPEMARLGLTNAMDSPKTLLNAVGVPRQVVVHHEVSALEVDAFTSGIRRQEYLNLRVVPERFLRLHPLFPSHAAVNYDHRFFTPKLGRNTSFQIAECVAVLREEDQFLRRRRRGRGNRPSAVGEPLRYPVTVRVRVNISPSRPGSSHHFRSSPLRRTASASAFQTFQRPISAFSSAIVRAAVDWSRISSSAACTSLSGASSKSSTSSASSVRHRPGDAAATSAPRCK